MQYRTIAALLVALAASPSILAYSSLHQPLPPRAPVLSNTDHTVGISARELIDALQARANDSPQPPPQPRRRRPAGVAPELQAVDMWAAGRGQYPAITDADRARLAEIERQRRQMEQQRRQMEEERRRREQQQRQGQ